MVVPQTKLLVWFSLVVLPSAALGGVEPAAMPLSVALIGVLLLLVLADLMRAQGNLDSITVKLPDVVRLSKDREGEIQIRIKDAREHSRSIRLGLALPREIWSREEDLQLKLPASTEWSSLTWPCTGIKRGSYAVDRAYLEAVSPFGFWAIRSGRDLSCEVRVYPNLRTERKNLAALFLNRGSFGIHAQRQVGRGRDFEKLREYIPGDGFDEIHWKATAKRGHPVTKVFQLERTQEVYVILDFSRLSRRTVDGPKAAASIRNHNSVSAVGELPWAPDQAKELLPTPAEATALERFISSALVLALAAEQQGDLFGLATFADKVETFVRAKNGSAHFNACREALYNFQPKVVTPDFDEVFTFSRLRLRRRSLIIFLTTLDDPVLAESFVRNIDMICRHHLVMVNMIRPPRAEPLFSNADATSLDDLYLHLGGHAQWQKLRELTKVLQRRGVRFSLLDHDAMSLGLVSQYLDVKRRQLL